MKVRNIINKIVISALLVMLLAFSVLSFTSNAESVQLTLYNYTTYIITCNIGTNTYTLTAGTNIISLEGDTTYGLTMSSTSGNVAITSPEISFDAFNPTEFSASPTFIINTTTDSPRSYYFRIASPTPAPVTPTPAPVTSTPAPVTPTPAPVTPTPIPTLPAVPTVPPADADKSLFFDKILYDAQQALNAMFSFWSRANSHFYTSILFVGLPILLFIVSIVASIFFGGYDD